MTAPLTQPTDRLRTELETLVELLLPRVMANLAAYVTWEVVVIAAYPPAPADLTPGTPAVFATPASVDVQPVDPAVIAVLGPTPLAKIPLWPGPDGVLSEPTVGSKVRICFVNGDRGKPAIVGCDPTVMPTISLVQALKVLTNANSGTWVGATAFATALSVLG